jgi:hypothetical protein
MVDGTHPTAIMLYLNNSDTNTGCIQRNASILSYSQEVRKRLKTPWPESASELCRPSDRCLSAKIVPTFADRGCHVVSFTDPYDRIHDFLDRSRYFFFEIAPQFYSGGWVDRITNSLLVRKSGSVWNRTRTSGSVARNSDHQTTEAVK